MSINKNTSVNSGGSWRIIADSACDLLPGKADGGLQSAYSVVPLTLIVGESEYPDVPTTDVREMLTHMHTFKGASSSACPSPEAFAQQYRTADQVIVVTITSGLSGTYNSAVLARQMILEEMPDKKIHVVDSRSTSGSMVLLLRRAEQLFQEDVPFPEICRLLDQYRDEMKVLFSLASFDNLVKTGRMSKTAGLIASALNIRAVATNTALGTIDVVDKPRGEKKAIEHLVARMKDYKDLSGKPVVISHCYNLEAAEAAAQAIKETYNTTDITLLETRGLCSYYADEKGFIVAF